MKTDRVILFKMAAIPSPNPSPLLQASCVINLLRLHLQKLGHDVLRKTCYKYIVWYPGLRHVITQITKVNEILLKKVQTLEFEKP